MPKIRNISNDTVYVQHLGVEVEPDSVIDVPGEHILTTNDAGEAVDENGQPLPADYYTNHPDARIWPGTVWHVVGDTTTPAHPAPADQPAES